MSYLAIKHIHVTFVALSGLLFLTRGLWMLFSPALLDKRWVRIVPHVVDTLLLASAVAMAVISQQYPFQQHWLTAKILALIVYIGLGTIALKRGQTYRVRVLAFIAALATFAYIVAVAFSKNALVFF